MIDGKPCKVLVRHTPATIACDSAGMDTQQAKFDWIAWYASIPGIPLWWGETPASTAPQEAAEELEVPLLEAA